MKGNLKAKLHIFEMCHKVESSRREGGNWHISLATLQFNSYLPKKKCRLIWVM
jgi:hypothetical protein